ncbi:unnamed protein product [Triticum turgidum subsp. durum]|uniref:Nuclear pore protein n=1 Tax=Triticum turgidum subsp. durum TaxID=4567 RepID=A0A9R0T1J4_TRITD|nr:unnamed protein product [Triticum turgidum subsp. durum]
MQKVWHLIQALVGEGLTHRNVSTKMSLVVGARRHLEWGHEKYIIETINSQPALAALGGSVGNLQKIRAFLRVRLRDHGVLDFDASDLRRQPPVDTTWQQVYFACLICIKHRIKIVADIVFFLSSNGNIKTHESKLNRLNGKLPLE